MKVKELLETLATFDPESEVWTLDENGWAHCLTAEELYAAGTVSDYDTREPATPEGNCVYHLVIEPRLF